MRWWQCFLWTVRPAGSESQWKTFLPSPPDFILSFHSRFAFPVGTSPNKKFPCYGPPCPYFWCSEAVAFICAHADHILPLSKVWWGRDTLHWTRFHPSLLPAGEGAEGALGAVIFSKLQIAGLNSTLSFVPHFLHFWIKDWCHKLASQLELRKGNSYRGGSSWLTRKYAW